MSEVTMLEELQGIANCCECEATEKRLNVWIKKASAAPEQEPFGYTNDAQISVLAEGRIANLYPCEGPGMNPIKLYTHPSAEIERLRSENKRLDLALAQADHNYDCDRQQFEQKLAEAQALLRDVQENGETNENFARIGNFLSATAQPAEVKS